jgi:hypothetical protein
MSANEAASLAAVIEYVSAHASSMPGLASLFVGGGSGPSVAVGSRGMTTNAMPPTNAYATGDNDDDDDDDVRGGISIGSTAPSGRPAPPRIVAEDAAPADVDDDGGGGDGAMIGEDDDIDIIDEKSASARPPPDDADVVVVATTIGHPSLPSIDDVMSCAVRHVNDVPPFVSMSVRDTAPQLKLDDPNIVDYDGGGGDVGGGGGCGIGIDGCNGGGGATTRDGQSFQRRLVVGGRTRGGYRMSRATHGASVGCYYYEALILGSGGERGRRGLKRPLHEADGETTGGSTAAAAATDNLRETKTSGGSAIDMSKVGGGHVRIGWSTRYADLQAPVGYNEHSYAIRDIHGSRIHKSRREDNWGGIGFGIGDVIGLAICLVDEKGGRGGRTTTTTTSDDNTASSSTDLSGGIDDKHCHERSNNATNHMRFFRNGKAMGSDGIGFDRIAPGTYYPAISCYGDGRAYMNFGPYFIYPPEGLPSNMDLRPISELCRPPPLPEEAVEGVISSGIKEGKNAFFSKRTDDGILLAFKELVRVEATARHQAYITQRDLHMLDIATIRKEHGLPT